MHPIPRPLRGLRPTLFVLVGLVIASAAFAQESSALINALIKKGVLTSQEAEAIQAEVAKERKGVPPDVVAAGKATERLSLAGRLQMQYASLDTDVRGATFGPVSTDHFFLRRVYLTVRAGLSPSWSALFTYDFAGGGYDDAEIEWRVNPDLKFDFGFRKVNVGYEEKSSSGNLKSIERSGVTRYFVEANNGRRLGAASHRIGVFMDAKRALTKDVGLVYGAAVTSPERPETFTLASSAGDGTNNKLAYWGNSALTGKLPNKGSWNIGGGLGYLPDQGGFGVANLGRGFDLNIYTAHAEASSGAFGLMAEFMTARVEGGRGFGTGAAQPRGFFVQPALMLSSNIEAVVRYQWLDTDGRGVTLPDVIRSAGASPLMDEFSEWYAGINWYLRGNDLRLQLGGISGETSKTTLGAPAKAKTTGIRSQLQMQF